MSTKERLIILQMLETYKEIIRISREQRSLLSKQHSFKFITDEEYEKRDEQYLDKMFSSATKSVELFEKLGMESMKAFYKVDEWLYD